MLVRWMHTESSDVTNNLWMTAFDWPKVGYYRIFMIIPYRDIECCPETNSAYAHATFYWTIVSLSAYSNYDTEKVFTPFKWMCFTQTKYYVNLKSGLLTSNRELWKPQEWPILLLGRGSYDNNDIRLILKTVMLRLLRPTSMTYVNTVMLRLMMHWQNGTW